MKNAIILSIAAISVAVVRAQGPYPDDEHTCAKPNAAYCAGSSLDTDIIIRCDSERRGQPGRCSDNLAGEPPLGNTPSRCWQTNQNSGDAACEKNCVVYGGSGNANGTFTLPAHICTPSYTASTTAAPTHGTGGNGGGGHGNHTTHGGGGHGNHTTHGGGGHGNHTTPGGGGHGTGGGGHGTGTGGGTRTSLPTGETTGSRTGTPIPPTKTPPHHTQPTSPTEPTQPTAVPTAGARANAAAGVLAAVGLVAGFLL